MNLDKYEAIKNKDWAKVRKIEDQEKKQELVEAIEELSRDKTDAFIDLIKDYARLERCIASLQQQNKELKAERYKDDEMRQMREEVKAMKKDYYRGFPIDEKEDTALKSWMEEHEKFHKGGHGCVGGKYTYIFTPTSIGTFGTIKCSCGESFNFQKGD